jgi:mannose-6-phosphate isomerase-like protein (cupin superfamily)
MARTKQKPKAKAKSSARAKTTARRAPARRTAARAKPKAKAKARRKQTFVVSHHNESDFDQGLRSYASYRDLGIAKATNGLAQAHVIRLIGPCDPKVVSKRHYHDVEFQMIYVLKGWMKGEYDGQEITVRAGSCWLQPPRIKHTVLDYSDDCELLEIILPAEFETVELEK